MTGCPGARELEDYLAGRLDQPTQDALTDHIENCPACQDQLETLTSRPALVLPEVLAVTLPADAAGMLLADRYRLRVRESGGGNAVWLASDVLPDGRLVAVTVVAPGPDAPARLRRFEAERAALTALDHPHIARPLDAGETPDGRLFFVREHIKGVPIGEHCAGPLPLRARLELFAVACDAVEAAHQKGIAHHDLRSSNVRVVETARGPMPAVIDFGTAQHEGTARDDVYALGALLSELLVGANRTNADRVALDQIVTAALRDERGHETAGALATDVRQFLAGDSPASRPSVVRRARSGVFVALLLLAALVVAGLVWAVYTATVGAPGK